MVKQSGSPFDFDFTKMMGDIKVPGVDMEGLMAAQKKNIDALTAANKVAFDSIQAVMKRQSELFRQAIEEATTAASSLTATAPLPEKMAKQTELTKEAFERAVANAKEVAEMLARSNTEVAQVVQTRFTEAMSEIKASIEKASAFNGPTKK
ncbi:MAG: phasin family protein [Rhodospirillaceae bacterium]